MDLASEVKQCLSSLWVVESDATMAVAMPNIDVWQPRVPCRFIFTLEEDDTVVSAKLVFGLLKWFSDRQPSVLSALMDLHQQSTAPFTAYSKETWDTLAMSAKDIADSLPTIYKVADAVGDYYFALQRARRPKLKMTSEIPKNTNPTVGGTAAQILDAQRLRSQTDPREWRDPKGQY